MSQNEATLPPQTATTPPTVAPMSMAEVLRIPVMRRLWYAQIVSTFGDFLALFAVMIVMTYQLRATPQQITGVQIAYMGPIAILGVLSGVFVDRWPTKITLVTSDYLRALLCLSLLLVHNVWGFYIALALISVVSSFFGPAQGVAIRTAVPRHGMQSAQSLLQQVMMIMRIIGGPIAAWFVSKLGPHPAYWLDAVSFIASGTLILSLTLTTPTSVPVVPDPTTNPDGVTAPAAAEPTGLARVVSDMKQGASFIIHHAALSFVILALASAMFVLGCFAPLIAVYVRDILHKSEKTFGYTSPMIGLGMLIGINLITTKFKGKKATTLVYSGLSGIAIGVFLLAALPHLGAMIPGLFIIGLSAAAVIVPAQTLIALETPPPMMGRVGSTVMSAIFTAQILGLILSGVLSEHISIRTVFALCGVMLLVMMPLGMWMQGKRGATA
ncbi:MFS transporter [Granulicella cerasi]|nr:MFS transporter [Granulicella cerasi]